MKVGQIPSFIDLVGLRSEARDRVHAQLAALRDPPPRVGFEPVLKAIEDDVKQRFEDVVLTSNDDGHADRSPALRATIGGIAEEVAGARAQWPELERLEVTPDSERLRQALVGALEQPGAERLVARAFGESPGGGLVARAVIAGGGVPCHGSGPTGAATAAVSVAAR